VLLLILTLPFSLCFVIKVVQVCPGVTTTVLLVTAYYFDGFPGGDILSGDIEFSVTLSTSRVL
jgi:hypothetical protein